MPACGQPGEPHIDPDAPARMPPHQRPAAWLLVMLDAAIGATVRITAEHLWPAAPGGWPWATFVINVVGSFVLGVALEVLARLGTDAGWRQNVRMFAATGVVSTLTTYSAMALEIVLLVRTGYLATAMTYATVSVLVGILAAWIGVKTVSSLHRSGAAQ